LTSRGKLPVVTGGLGQLGRQFAKALSNAGAKVAIVDVRTGEEDGAIMMQADITKKNDVRNAFEKIEAALGTPNILINNAGIDAPPNAPPETTGPFETFPEEVWDAVMDSHLKGAFLISQEFIKRLRVSGKQGSIINISSTYGVVTSDQSLYDFKRKNGEVFFKPVVYSVAKSGMLNFTRWLAEYGAPLNIRANTLVPGGVFNNQPEEFVREYSRRTPMGRMASEDEYNGALLFLASHKASSYMTGSTLIVDGGWTAR